MAEHQSVEERVNRLDLPFNSRGIDPYGISKEYLVGVGRVFELLYRHYFRVRVHNIDQVPAHGRGMIIGNHSGGVAIDGAMLITACLLDMEPPRLLQGMAEKFINRFPFASILASRTGQFTGLPEHARRILEDDRLLMVFPEGARGTAKLYKERHTLVDFGTGFMRLALQTKSPIIPVAVLGGSEAFPTFMNSYTLGRLVGVPYVPITSYLLPIPRPARMDIYFGAPMHFRGTGSEEDEVIQRYVDEVKEVIAGLIERNKKHRLSLLGSGQK